MIYILTNYNQHDMLGDDACEELWLHIVVYIFILKYSRKRENCTPLLNSRH